MPLRENDTATDSDINDPGARCPDCAYVRDNAVSIRRDGTPMPGCMEHYTINGQPRSTPSFDLGDNEHLQKIIKESAEALGNRITNLEQALQAQTAATRAAIESRDELFIKFQNLSDRIREQETPA